MSIDGVNPYPAPVDSESGWKENPEDEKATAPRYVDAFGDESNAEVKYKTMEWW